MIEQHRRLFLVYVAIQLYECERRDPKGLYVKSRTGLLASFTGVSDMYEPPADCDTTIDTTGLTLHVSTDRIVRGLAAKGLPLGLWLVAGLRIGQASPSQEESTHHVLVDRNEERRARLFQCVVRGTAERRVTLTEVAREVGVERHTVERVVRSIIGQSFRELQRNLLSERANLLLEQGRAIKEIAFEVGYGSPQSFHRFIRRAQGITPSCASVERIPFLCLMYTSTSFDFRNELRRLRCGLLQSVEPFSIIVNSSRLQAGSLRR